MKTSIVLRHQRDGDGLRHLEAILEEDGDLVIEGQDLGRGVEEFFGSREYEWTWTIRAAHLPDLMRALAIQADPLAALEERFSGDRAGELKAFLDDQSIPREIWSRLGD